MLLKEMGFKPEDYLIERENAWEYKFYNIHTKQLMDIRY